VLNQGALKKESKLGVYPENWYRQEKCKGLETRVCSAYSGKIKKGEWSTMTREELGAIRAKR
jgi:hypothetical protein